MKRLAVWALLLGAAVAADAAELELRCGVVAVNTWDAAGTGSAYPVSFYLAPAQGDFYPLGVTASREAAGKAATQCLVRDVSARGDALAAPTDFERVWWDRGSSALRDGSVWRPRCPSGYVGLGVMVQASYRKPELQSQRCVREALTVAGAAAPDSLAPAQLDGSVYMDFGSRAFEDLSVWRVKADGGVDAGTVFAWQTHTMPTAKDGVRVLRSSMVQATP